jgi:hypothetical protein
MRVRRLLALLAAAVLGVGSALVLGPAPALAGNWAVTLLDPLPERLEPAKGYTVGFWVLQHGFHPYEGGKMDPVGLRFTDTVGNKVEFAGVELPEKAHYAATVAIPGPGVWNVTGIQGPFGDYRIGTLTVPGGLTVLGVPEPLQASVTQQYWPGAIRPPAVPVDPDRNPFGTESSVQVPAPAASQQAAAPAAEPGRSPAQLVLLGGVALAAVAALALVGSRRRVRRPDAPSGTLVSWVRSMPDPEPSETGQPTR